MSVPKEEGRRKDEEEGRAYPRRRDERSEGEGTSVPKKKGRA